MFSMGMKEWTRKWKLITIMGYMQTTLRIHSWGLWPGSFQVKGLGLMLQTGFRVSGVGLDFQA